MADRKATDDTPAEAVARAWLHAYGIDTESYRRGGSDHPAMRTLPQAFEAFARKVEPSTETTEVTSTLTFRDLLIAYVSGLVSNRAKTIGQGVDALLADMGRLGFRVVKEPPKATADGRDLADELRAWVVNYTRMNFSHRDAEYLIDVLVTTGWKAP